MSYANSEGPNQHVNQNTAETKPVPVVTFNRRAIVPFDLTRFDQFVVWMFEARGGRLTKVPYISCEGRGPVRFYRASINKAGHWKSYLKTWSVWANNGGVFGGIGFVFTAGDPFVGIDLDRCLSLEGVLADWARSILARFPSAYVELSPSGMGLKMWVKGRLPGAGKRGRFQSVGDAEIYDRNRFFTLTGRPYGEAVEAYSGFDAIIPDFSEAVLALYEEIESSSPRPGEGKSAAPTAASGGVGQEGDGVSIDLANRPPMSDLHRRIIKLIPALKPAVSGKGGQAATLSAARAIAWGFALTPEEAWPYLVIYSRSRCSPSWDEDEDGLKRKLDQALTTPDPEGRPFGFMLNKSPKRSGFPFSGGLPRPFDFSD